MPHPFDKDEVVRTMLSAGWTAHELALAGGVDPTPVPIVERSKRRLQGVDENC